MTLLHRTSIPFNKSLTILKMTFYEIAQAQFMSVKFDNVKYFFRKPPRSKIITHSEPTRVMTLLHRTSIPLNKSLTILKMTLWNCASTVFEREIWQRSRYFFRKPPRSKISTHSEPTRVMTLLDRTSIHLNKSLTILKMTFYEIAQAQFLSVKFDNVVSTFFVNHLDQKLSLIQNLLGLWHSYIEPQFIWTSPWPYWKWLFMKLRKHSFWAWNLTT